MYILYTHTLNGYWWFLPWILWYDIHESELLLIYNIVILSRLMPTIGAPPQITSLNGECHFVCQSISSTSTFGFSSVKHHLLLNRLPRRWIGWRMGIKYLAGIFSVHSPWTGKVEKVWNLFSMPLMLYV